MRPMQSPLLLQPQNLHHLTRQQMLKPFEAINGDSRLVASKPRSYSASSEMLLTAAYSNNQYKLNTRALVGSPIHRYHHQQQQPQRPQHPQRASSSSSMLHDQVPTRSYHHPYQQLPGANLSLQSLDMKHPTSNGGGCVYLRPEQNIPEVFANSGTIFKPIDEVDNGSDANDNDVRSHQEGTISRDDIVVTMHSVNVW